jgi:hypothetical protein
MLMKSLHHGGLNPVYDPSLDDAYARSVHSLNGYHPNPNGIYESQVNVKARGFIQRHRDKLVKVLRWQVQDLPTYRYEVVLMLRNPVEVDMSMRRIGKGEGQTPRLYQGYQDRIQLILESRSDVNLHIFDYATVVSHPHTVFESLKESDFPIDPKLAASVVDEKLYRHRAA